MVKETFSVFRLRRNLDKPYSSFHGFHLTEEWTDATELVKPPVLEKPGRLRSHLPLIRVRQGTPRIHVAANFIDNRSRIVLLLLRRKPLAFIENDFLLCIDALPFLGLWNRRDELGAAAGFKNLLRGLPVLIQLPMFRRALVWRV